MIRLHSLTVKQSKFKEVKENTVTSCIYTFNYMFGANVPAEPGTKLSSLSNVTHPATSVLP